MPLEPCYECNKEISTLARSCPNCGHRVKIPRKKPHQYHKHLNGQQKMIKNYYLCIKRVPEFALAKILKKTSCSKRKDYFTDEKN